MRVTCIWLHAASSLLHHVPILYVRTLVHWNILISAYSMFVHTFLNLAVSVCHVKWTQSSCVTRARHQGAAAHYSIPSEVHSRRFNSKACMHILCVGWRWVDVPSTLKLIVTGKSPRHAHACKYISLVCVHGVVWRVWREHNFIKFIQGESEHICLLLYVFVPKTASFRTES